MVELQVKLLEYVMKIWRQEDEERLGLFSFSTFYNLQYANLLARGDDICRMKARRETIKIWFFFFLLWSLPASYLSLFIPLIFRFLSNSLLGKLCCIKLNPSRRSRKAATSCHRPATNRPAASRQPPAVCRHSRQPPSHLKVEFSCFEFVYK